MAIDDLQTIQNLCRRLEDFAVICESALEAICSGDDAKARALVDESRKMRMALGQAQSRAESAKLPNNPQGVALLLQMKRLMQRVHLGDAGVQEWLKQGAVGLAASEVKDVEQVVDGMLPTAWDGSHDLAVVVGSDTDGIAHALVKRGVTRLMVCLHEDEPAETKASFPPSSMFVTDTPSVRATLVTFGAPTPKAVAWYQGEDSKIDKELRDELMEAVHTGVRWLNSNVITAEHLGAAWVTHGLKNLPTIARNPGVDRLDEAFRGRPVVIVSAGPSLDKNIAQLAELKDKALIIAISQAAKALDRAGIAPDLVIASDALDLSVHFDGVDLDKIGGLVLEATIHPNVFALPATRLFTYAGMSFIENWVAQALESTSGTRNMRVSSGGSVSTTAFALALRWQCDPIVLVGQDLALTDGRIYAGGGVDADTKLKFSDDGTTFVMEGKRTLQAATGDQVSEEERVEWVDGYHGGKVQTSLGYSLFLRWFEAVSETAKDHARIINCTEGGARINGFEHMPLKEWSDSLDVERMDVERLLDDADIPASDRGDRARRVLGELCKASATIERSAKQAKHCRELAVRIKKNPDARGQRDLKKLSAAEAELIRLLKEVTFISLIKLDQIHAARELGNAARNVFENLRAAINLYDVVLEGANELRPIIRRAEAELREAAGAKAA